MKDPSESLPTISVVIPSLNQGQYLDQCLVSIFEQHYPKTEIIVIDGGSEDETATVLRQHEEQIAYWVSEPDRGQSHALNKGFAKATGDIFCWQNSDDFYLDGAFWAAAGAFQRDPDAPLVFGDWIEVDEAGNSMIKWYAFDLSERSAKYGGANAITQAMFWTRDVHERFGDFPEELHQVMDHYLTFRIGMNEGFDRFVRIPKSLMAFRRHAHQKTGNLAADRVHAELVAMDRMLGIHRRSGLAGLALRLGYRILRAIRYLRRGGIRYFASVLRHHQLSSRRTSV